MSRDIWAPPIDRRRSHTSYGLIRQARALRGERLLPFLGGATRLAYSALGASFGGTSGHIWLDMGPPAMPTPYGLLRETISFEPTDTYARMRLSYNWSIRAEGSRSLVGKLGEISVVYDWDPKTFEAALPRWEAFGARLSRNGVVRSDLGSPTYRHQSLLRSRTVEALVMSRRTQAQIESDNAKMMSQLKVGGAVPGILKTLELCFPTMLQ